MIRPYSSTYQSSASRQLSVAYVLYNDRSSMSVEAQSCRSTWDGIAVKHLKEYRRNDSEGSEVTLEPTEDFVKLTILYRTLVKVVELHVDGRMFQGDASALAKGGWSFKLSEEESVRAIAGALILEHQIRSTPKMLVSGDEKTYVVCEEAAAERWRRRTCRPVDDVGAKL